MGISCKDGAGNGAVSKHLPGWASDAESRLQAIVGGINAGVLNSWGIQYVLHHIHGKQRNTCAFGRDPVPVWQLQSAGGEVYPDCTVIRKKQNLRRFSP